MTVEEADVWTSESWSMGASEHRQKFVEALGLRDGSAQALSLNAGQRGPNVGKVLRNAHMDEATRPLPFLAADFTPSLNEDPKLP